MTRIGLIVVMALTACGKTDPELISAPDIIGDTLPMALTSTPGDPARGEALFADRDGAHCVLCHRVEGLDAPFQGNVGQDLSNIGNRLSDAQIRLRIVDYEQVKPGVTMPSYYRIHGINQVGEEYENQPALTAQSIEDIIAYLSVLETSPDV